jgi:hypothetical protein
MYLFIILLHNLLKYLFLKRIYFLIKLFIFYLFLSVVIFINLLVAEKFQKRSCRKNEKFWLLQEVSFYRVVAPDIVIQKTIYPLLSNCGAWKVQAIIVSKQLSL